jgi:hypothetical protein
MEILVPFLNYDQLARHISTSMSNILTYQHDSSRQDKEIRELTQLFDALPVNVALDSISLACQLFDYFLQNLPSNHCYRLLSSCLTLMNNDDRLQRINHILITILDHEQAASLRELLCKLLISIESSASESIKIDWTYVESTIHDQQDSKCLMYVWRFLSKHHRTRLEQILVRLLSDNDKNDQLCLLLLIELESIPAFVFMSTFWQLLQRSLGNSRSNDDRTRKCALYLLKHIIVDVECPRIEIKDEKSNQFLVLIDDKSQQFWMDFIVIFDALEDGIVHLIKPLLIKFDRLLQYTLETGS